MRTRALLLLLVLILSSCAARDRAPGHGFEGTITEVIQMPGLSEMAAGRRAAADSDNGVDGSAMIGAAANMTMKLYVRENKLAYDVSLLGGLINMRSIIDRNARTLTVLLPTHTAMVMDLRAVDTMRPRIEDSLRAHTGLFDSLTAMLPQPTGKRETMHGMEVEQYRASRGDDEIELWLSSNEKLKAFEIMRDALLGRQRPGGESGIAQIFAMLRPVAGKIPVRFETKKNGKTFMKGEMTEITEVHLPDELFEIPKDYQIVRGDGSANDTAAPSAVQPPKHITGP